MAVKDGSGAILFHLSKTPYVRDNLDSKAKNQWTKKFTTKLADKVVSQTPKNKWVRKNW